MITFTNTFSKEMLLFTSTSVTNTCTYSLQGFDAAVELFDRHFGRKVSNLEYYIIVDYNAFNHIMF